MSLTQYLFTAIKINYLVLGGASLTAPFYFQYYVETDLIPEQEINHYLTMANILPGAMSIYMTAYTGLYLHGKKGLYLGLSALFIPIALISILILEVSNFINFDISIIVYISLPIMLVAALDYVKSVMQSPLRIRYKFGLFGLVLLLLTFALLGTIQIILIYIFVIWLVSRRMNHA